jgi:DNA-binding response OmpR family regulator
MKKILIADDDKVFTELVSTRLRAKGFEVFVAYDTMQAGMLALRHHPDAILLDVKMPGGSGLDALTRLKKSAKTADIPVIVVSALQDPGLAAEVGRLGAIGFVAKPAQFDQVLDVLSLALAPGNKPTP